MPQAYQTYEDFEAAIERPRGTDEAAGLTSTPAGTTTAALPTSGGIAQAPALDATPAEPLKPIEASGAAGSTPSFSLQSYAGNPEIAEQYGNLFKPLMSDLSKATGTLQGAQKTFSTAAGPYRSWESIQGANAINAALTPDTDLQKDQAEMEAAKGLVTAKYGGPTALDQATLDELQKSLAGYQSRAGALSSGGGIQALLQQQSSTPASPEELAVEASRLMTNPDFARSAVAIGQDVGTLSSQLSRAQREAAGIAARRTGEEEAIAGSARGMVEGERGKIAQTLQDRIRQADEEEAAFQKDFAKFLDSGDTSLLEKYQPGIAAQFNTPGKQLYTQGKTALQDLLQKQYGDIANVPLLQPQITTRGRGTYGWSDEDWTKMKELYPDRAQLEQIRQRAVERQDALSKAGFDPAVMSGHYINSDQAYVLGDQPLNEAAAGKYSTMFPMAFDDSTWEPIDLRGYVSSKEGTGATIGNQVTAAEADRYNRASQLLDLQDRLQVAETPYQKQQIIAEGQKYLEDEIKSLEARRGELTANEEEFLTAVREAHADYSRAARQKMWGRALAIAGGILGAGAGGIALNKAATLLA